VLVRTEPGSILGNMRPVISDFSAEGDSLAVSWLRMSPYASSGTFVSRVLDGGSRRDWGVTSWSSEVPTGTSLAIDVRAGDSAVPDGSWSAFLNVATRGGSAGVSGRYVQYRARLATTVPAITPVLRDFSIACLDATVVAGLNGTTPTVTMARPPAPNPAQYRAVFEYEIGRDAAGGGSVDVSFAIFDLAGRAVRQLVHGPQPAGRYRRVWDVRDDRGQAIGPGVYFYRLRAGRISRNGSVVVIR
jgi:hypothetical protein